MYHSVCGETKSVRGSFPITMKRFTNQINQLLARGWSCAAITDIHEEVEVPTFYISSDDGTVDWARNVLPWCEDRQLFTHTAISTGCWFKDPIYPLAHIVQVVLSTRNQIDLYALATNLKSLLSNQQLQYINAMYHYEALETRRVIKGAANLILSEEVFLEAILPLSDHEQNLLHCRFEQPNYYKNFDYALIGSHGVRHKALYADIDHYVEHEILPTLTHFKVYGISPSVFFTNPMKPESGVSLHELSSSLRDLGFKGILTCCGDWDQKDFIIPRIDAKHIEQYFGLEVVS